MIHHLNSITLKVILVTLVTIFAFGALATIGTHYLLVDQISRQKTADFQNILENGAVALEKVFAVSQNLADNVATDDSSIAFLTSPSSKAKDLTTINSHLAQYNLGGQYPAIYLINNGGTAIASTDFSFIGQDYSFRPYFIESIKGSKFTDVYYGIKTRKLGYFFSAPVRNHQNQIIGVAVVKLDTEPVKNTFKNLVSVNINDLMLVDHFGIIVETNRPERLYQSLGKISQDTLNEIGLEKKYGDFKINPLQYQPVQKFIDQHPTATTIISINDSFDTQREKVFLVPILGTSYYLICETNLNETTKVASNIATFISYTVGAAAIAAIIVLSLFLTYLLSPIRQLSKMAREISKGNYDVSSDIHTHDEFFALGQVFQNMSVSLKNKYQELEEVVSSRTHKLESQTEILSKTQLAIQNLLDDANSARDEAELAANELEKFKKAVDNSTDHIAITDPDGIVVYANPATAKLTGYSVAEIIGKKVGSKTLWGGQMPLFFYQKLWKTIKIDKKPFSGEIYNHRKNGQRYISDAHIYPILNSQSEVVFFVGIERDATVAREIDRMKTEFVSFASHQLRTPLSAMKWFSEMLLSGDAGKLNSQQSEFVTNIYQSNERMIKLVKNLLDISRIESGRIIIDPAPTDVSKLINDIVAEVNLKATEKQQKIIIEISPKLPLINLDPELIKNVYQNLLTNAIKYTPKKGKITISIVKKGLDIISQVTDSGYGIPKDELLHIFEKFFRASNIQKIETEGTGLGLYIVKSVVESSGGKVGVKSIENIGSTFWFSLPIKGVPPQKGDIHLGS